MTITRWAALFGLLAAVFLVAGVLISGDTPDGDEPDEEWVQYIEDDGVPIMIRAYLFVGTALALAALYALGLHPRVSGPDAADAALARLGGGAIVLAGASFIFGGLIGAGVAGAEMFGDVPVDAGLARTFDNLVYGALLVGGALSMAVVMTVVAIQTRRRNAFPQWVLWVSLLGILGMAASVIFVPFVLLPIWLLAVSFALFRSDAKAAV